MSRSFLWSGAGAGAVALMVAAACSSSPPALGDGSGGSAGNSGSSAGTGVSGAAGSGVSGTAGGGVGGAAGGGVGGAAGSGGTMSPGTVFIDGKCWPLCASAATDPDGDGWGFENNASCVVVGSAVQASGGPCPTGTAGSSGGGAGGSAGSSASGASGAGTAGKGGSSGSSGTAGKGGGGSGGSAGTAGVSGTGGGCTCGDTGCSRAGCPEICTNMQDDDGDGLVDCDDPDCKDTLFCPAGWTCPYDLYFDGTCDCGCGILDGDCPGPTSDVCVGCQDEGSCSNATCSNVLPNDNTHCL